MNAFGEVLSSSVTGFTAQTWSEENTASFGSFIKAYSEESRQTVYGVVYNVITGPYDNHHKPTAQKKSRRKLSSEQPQIFALLKTELQVATIGYETAGTTFPRLPPHPPQIHDFVYKLSNEELCKISTGCEFLSLLGLVTGVPQDEFLAKAIQEAAQTHPNNYAFLLAAGQYLSQLFRHDYDKLISILSKIQPA